jgi:2-octaprenyl-6-methoxyphenol hydroxylase
MVKMTEPDFLTKLQHTFGYRLGRFNQVGKRITFPLKQVTLSKLVSGSVVFIGNAAHTLHPIAGQGFNLGLRDIAMLAQCIAKHGLGADMLHIYQQARQHDHKIITHFTDSLIELFNPHFPGARLSRGMGLAAFDNLPFLKRLLSRYARGFGGVIPDLACEIPLRSSH